MFEPLPDYHASSIVERVRGSCERLLPKTLQWLERMVGINSFTANAAGVNQLGNLTVECFASLGFTAEFVQSIRPDYGRHLFLRRKGHGKLPVILVTHLDTVYPVEEELRNNFHWEPSSEGRIYGPGTVDIKGGTALIWMMLHALRECAPDVFESTEWIVAANASEEVLGDDFGAATERRTFGQARAVLIFEGGPRQGHCYHLVSARKGRAEYRIRAEGRGAHAGSYHAEGVNAVVALASAAQAAARLTNYDKDLTVNVANIQGGTVLNRVPHEAMLELEMRAFDPTVLAEARQRLEELSHPGELNMGRAALQVDCLGVSPAWPETSNIVPLVHAWEKAAAELGMTIKTTARGGLSDGNYLHGLGPTLDGLGPDGGCAHCSERSADGSKTPEYVDSTSIVPKATLNVLALLEFLCA